MSEREEKLMQALWWVWENDKTKYHYRGPDRKNRDGQDCDKVGGRWQTPMEIAEETLKEFGRFPYKTTK